MAATIAAMMIPTMAPAERPVSMGGVSVMSDRTLRSANPASKYSSSFSCGHMTWYGHMVWVWSHDMGVVT